MGFGWIGGGVGLVGGVRIRDGEGGGWRVEGDWKRVGMLRDGVVVKYSFYHSQKIYKWKRECDIVRYNSHDFNILIP